MFAAIFSFLLAIVTIELALQIGRSCPAESTIVDCFFIRKLRSNFDLFATEGGVGTIKSLNSVSSFAGGSASFLFICVLSVSGNFSFV
uniref:Secreted protein n=1 Tax=Anopheles atroparvus TaxID=41427 RepID=A0AAG5D453_ANOAO